MLNLLAFDYGASSGRAIVGEFDGKALKLSELHRFANEPVQVSGSLYWDILRLYQWLFLHFCLAGTKFFLRISF